MTVVGGRMDIRMDGDGLGLVAMNPIAHKHGHILRPTSISLLLFFYNLPLVLESTTRFLVA
jgi:hypothetical protein